MLKVSFCGISGSGMSSLAQILKLSGHQVSGSDRNFDLGRDLSTKEKMEKMGIIIHPQDGSGISADLDWICASTAAQAAQNAHLPSSGRPSSTALRSARSSASMTPWQWKRNSSGENGAGPSGGNDGSDAVK